MTDESNDPERPEDRRRFRRAGIEFWQDPPSDAELADQ